MLVIQCSTCGSVKDSTPTRCVSRKGWETTVARGSIGVAVKMKVCGVHRSTIIDHRSAGSTLAACFISIFIHGQRKIELAVDLWREEGRAWKNYKENELCVPWLTDACIADYRLSNLKMVTCRLDRGVRALYLSS